MNIYSQRLHKRKKKNITISNIKNNECSKYSIFTEVDRMILINYVILKSGVECKRTV